MKPTFHPAMFLGAALLLCTAWLWTRPAVPAATAFARSSAPRPALVAPPSIELNTAILERYAGRYEGRGGFTVDVTLKDGALLLQSSGTISSIPLELRATSQTQFYLQGPGAPVGVDVEFDVTRDGTVRGFSANTPYGLITVKRTR